MVLRFYQKLKKQLLLLVYDYLNKDLRNKKRLLVEKPSTIFKGLNHYSVIPKI